MSSLCAASATSGVRPLRRYIEREIVTSLAMAMVKGQLGDENTVRVYTRWQAAACSSGRLTPKRSNQQRRLLLCHSESISHCKVKRVSTS